MSRPSTRSGAERPTPPSPETLSCPSAQPDMAEARIFGVIGGTVAEPRVGYLKRGAVVTSEIAAQIGDLDPTQVFRFAARCENGRCAQFSNGRCSLGQRVADSLPPVADGLPSCQIRNTCRWHAELGDSVCYRCPQVVTLVPEDQNPLRQVAVPPELRAAPVPETG